VDLCDNAWRVIEVDDAGWRLATDCPVRFVRRRGMYPMPEPVRGGSVTELRPVPNVGDKADPTFILIVAFLVACMRPGLPFPLLVGTGEPGWCKSSLCKMLRDLVDPNKLPLRRPPREERDLAIATCNAWLVAYDNMSSLAPWLSDAVCSVTTGAGF